MGVSLPGQHCDGSGWQTARCGQQPVTSSWWTAAAGRKVCGGRPDPPAGPLLSLPRNKARGFRFPAGFLGLSRTTGPHAAATTSRALPALFGGGSRHVSRSRTIRSVPFGRRAGRPAPRGLLSPGAARGSGSATPGPKAGAPGRGLLPRTFYAPEDYLARPAALGCQAAGTNAAPNERLGHGAARLTPRRKPGACPASSVLFGRLLRPAAAPPSPPPAPPPSGIGRRE